MSTHARIRATLVVLTIAGLTVAAAAAGEGHDWPQFRGIDRDGASQETGLKSSWPEAGPTELWRVPLGEGYSAVSVVGDRLYTMYAAEIDGAWKEVAAAFDAATGKELWHVAVGDKYDTEFGNGPRSTPTVDGDAVYVLGSRGDLAALATADGAVRWTANLTEAFGSKVPTWGFATSPLVHGDLVLVEGGGPEGKTYAGIAKATGEVKWTSGDGGPGYNSPLAVSIGGKPHVVYVSSSGQIRCIDPDGKEVWSQEWPRGETHAIPVPVPPDRLFVSGAEGVGAKMYRLGAEGVELLWESRFMRNHFSASVVHEGTIYGFDNATLKAISAEDGRMAWAKRGLGKGSLILADGHLIVLSDRGELILAEASPKAYVEQGRVQAMGGRCWTAPVLSGGRLVLRNHVEMVAYDLTK